MRTFEVALRTRMAPTAVAGVRELSVPVDPFPGDAVRLVRDAARDTLRVAKFAARVCWHGSSR